MATSLSLPLERPLDIRTSPAKGTDALPVCGIGLFAGAGRDVGARTVGAAGWAAGAIITTDGGIPYSDTAEDEADASP